MLYFSGSKVTGCADSLRYGTYHRCICICDLRRTVRHRHSCIKLLCRCVENRHSCTCGPVLLRDLKTLGYRRLDLGRVLHGLRCTLGCLLNRMLRHLNRTLHGLGCTLWHLLNRTLSRSLSGLGSALHRHRLSCALKLQRYRLRCALRCLLNWTLHGLRCTLGHLLSLRLQRLGLALHCACRALLVHGSSYIFGSGHTLRRRLISGETGRLRTLLGLTFKGSLMLYSPYDCRIS